MQSLKTFMPELSKILGITVDQAYERQRVLVKAGLLKSRAGRGPGSGVPATPKNIATLLVALLLGDLRQHSVATVRAIANAKPIADQQSGEKFADVLARTIGSKFTSFTQWPERILVWRDNVSAEIYWPSHKGKDRRVIYSSGPQGTRALRAQAVLDGAALLQIRRALAGDNGDMPQEDDE